MLSFNARSRLGRVSEAVAANSALDVAHMRLEGSLSPAAHNPDFKSQRWGHLTQKAMLALVE